MWAPWRSVDKAFHEMRLLPQVKEMDTPFGIMRHEGARSCGVGTRARLATQASIQTQGRPARAHITAKLPHDHVHPGAATSLPTRPSGHSAAPPLARIGNKGDRLAASRCRPPPSLEVIEKAGGPNKADPRSASRSAEHDANSAMFDV